MSGAAVQDKGDGQGPRSQASAGEGSGGVRDPRLFAALEPGGRVWAVAAVHGEAEKLSSLHAALWGRFRPGDRVVYLGNYFGHGAAVRAAVDGVLLFRRALLAERGAACEDIVFLRGAQEEMLHKLMQLQFAPNPAQVLSWMLDQGVRSTLISYGLDPDHGFSAAREGPLALARWTGRLRDAVRLADGHTLLMSSLRHAAYTKDQSLLLVAAGLDPSRPLSAQSDSFWWGHPGFAALDTPYQGFRVVVRGYARKPVGVSTGRHAVTIDGGGGRGGPLIAALFDDSGVMIDTIES